MSLHASGFCFTDATGAPFSHDPILACASFVIAAIGSYAGLDMAERLRGASGARAWMWLAGSAATLGGSIWAMHFIGLLAMQIGLPVGYDPVVTALSLVLVIGFMAAGLQIGRSGTLSNGRLLLAGMVIGLGITVMHYAGMAALLVPATIAYRPVPFLLSVLIALGAATASLWMALTLRAVWQRGLAALAMATAICAMHYTGVSATEFLPAAFLPAAHGPEVVGITVGPLAVAVAGITLALLILALLLVAVDRRLIFAARHEAEALRAANTELETTQREIVRRLCRAGEFRDEDTGEHVDRIGLMAERLALAARQPAAFAESLRLAAPLHDIGKIGIPDAILLKPGKLTAAEHEQIQLHAEIGHDILAGSGIRLLDFAAEIALCHHERWDGTGYPRRLAGTAIPLGSRIVAVVDVFDALMARRPYKEPWPLDAAAAHLRQQSGSHFDPALVDAMLGELPAMVGILTRHSAPAPLAARLRSPGVERQGELPARVVTPLYAQRLRTAQ